MIPRLIPSRSSPWLAPRRILHRQRKVIPRTPASGVVLTASSVLVGWLVGSRVLASSTHTLGRHYASRYIEDGMVYQGYLDDGLAFLPTPFIAHPVSGQVREVLDRAAHATADASGSAAART